MERWIKLYDKIREHFIWQNAEYLKWWLDLLFSASYRQKKILINGRVLTLEAGEFHTSELALSKRWYVDRKTVRRFLSLLEEQKMVALKKSRADGTTLKILNYAAYQAVFIPPEEDKKESGRDKKTDKKADITIEPQNERQKDKEREDAPASSQKKAPAPPSREEVRSYCRGRKSPVDPDRFFDYFDAGGWIDSKGKPVQSWKQKLISWEGNARPAGKNFTAGPAPEKNKSFAEIVAERTLK